MFVVIGILIGLAAGAALAFIALYALTGSRLAAARRTRQLLVTDAVSRGASPGAGRRTLGRRSPWGTSVACTRKAVAPSGASSRVRSTV